MDRRRLLNLILVVGIADALLLVVLVYFAFVNRDESMISILGPIHGIGFLALLFLTVRGVTEQFWSWWFPAAVFFTGGPLGSIVGEIVERKRLRAATA